LFVAPPAVITFMTDSAKASHCVAIILSSPFLLLSVICHLWRLCLLHE
jgi:hypothetical protein